MAPHRGKRRVNQRSGGRLILLGFAHVGGCSAADRPVCKTMPVSYPFTLAGVKVLENLRMSFVRTTAATAVSIVALAAIALAPARAADPLGTWWTADRDAKIKIVNCNGSALCGTLVWIAEPLDPETHQPKTDKNNPDASKRGRPLLGIPIVLNMTPAGPDKWQGHLYNSRDGGIYSGSFAMTGPNTAQLRGCVMGGLICKGQIWTRAN
jgi:uncharacterized protein (DUF2147 family)